MPIILTVLMILWALLWVIAIAWARRSISAIPLLPPLSTALVTARWPLISVIVPARNEAAMVETAMRSLLAQHYPHLEIIAVNDHSSDATGAILDQLAATDPRLRVIHDPALGPGWLGKPNAQHAAAREARGEWLILVDADIVFAPDAFMRALAAALAQSAAGLSLLPRLHSIIWAEGAQFPWLIPLGMFTLRPHEANREGGAGFAAGAFILLRRTVYDIVGGHEALKDAVLDDVELGRLVKQAGHRFLVYDGHDVARVSMYRSVRDCFYGMVKNISYIVGGRAGHPWLAPLMAAALALAVSLPPVLAVYALATAEWPLALAAGTAYLAPIALSLPLPPALHTPTHNLLLYPVPVWLLLGATTVASYYRLKGGSVLWRGRAIAIIQK